MNIENIDERRRRLGVTQKRLCSRAGVNPTTYSQIKNRRRGAYAATLERLTSCLDAFEAEKAGGSAGQ